MNIRLEIRKTPRCSGTSEILADMLSKGKCQEALSNMKGVPRLVVPPRTFLKYMENPRPTRLLGKAMLMEMAESYEVLPLEPELGHEMEDLIPAPSRVQGMKWKQVD